MTVSKECLKIVFLFFLAFFLFHPALFYFFSQDDFYNLYISQAKSFSDFFDFFKFRNDVIFYRPLSIQFYFWLSKSLFGLNPFGFHLIGLGFHFLNIFLVYYLVSKLTGSKPAAFLSSFFYATAGFHFMAIFWISEFSMIIGPAFYFLAVIFFLKFQEKGRKIHWLFSFASFLFGLLSTEMIITLPLILGVWLLVFAKQKRRFLPLAPFVLTIGAYLFLRLLIFPIPASGTYQMRPGPQTFNTSFWYLVWNFNAPEEIKYQAVTILRPNPQFLFDFPRESLVFSGGFFAFLLLSGFSFLSFFKEKILKEEKNRRLFLFGLLWWMISLSPVLFIPGHQYPLYLTIPSLGLFLSLSLLFSHLPKTIIFLVLSFWLILSFAGISFEERIHWLTSEAKKAKESFSVWGGVFYFDETLRIRSGYPPEIRNCLLDPKNEKTGCLKKQKFYRL